MNAHAGTAHGPRRLLRAKAQQHLAGLDRQEIIDSLADGKLGQVLRIIGHLQGRNTRFSPAQEVTQMLINAFSYSFHEEVGGNYAEFGVFQGRTFVEAYRVARRFPDEDRRFFAFDSFQGLPEIAEIDAGERWAAGQFAADLPSFEARLGRARVPPSKTAVVPGFFDQTLSQPAATALDRIGIAWVDCDLYESTVPVLDYLTDRLVQGAVLAFDDWYCFRGARDKGESRACGEWLERNPHLSLVQWLPFHWAGQSFLVQRAE